MDLEGKTVLITGGAARVGRGITLAMAAAGANVVINYNSSADAAARTTIDAEALGVQALAIQASVSDYEQVGAMVDAAVDRFGTIDVLVNNASVFVADPLPTNDLTAWHRSIDTLVHGPFYCANRVAPVMLANGGGVIIGIGDLSAFEPWPGFAGHAVGKGAILSLTRQLALELGPTIRANAVVPGPALRPVNYDDATYERVKNDTLLERWGTPAEMAHAVRFLIEADYITGEVITVDGGQRLAHRKHAHG
ncbi:MAG TPA: SDR family oxidoreductase [Ilumatobacteraceae bacterium]|nr:SDR family oxidoreductase [Ilumatobacteraceae bacterium]HRB04403.1 SDR family oxidoreductase [Ilumatobacteraceae bacterium]